MTRMLLGLMSATLLSACVNVDTQKTIAQMVGTLNEANFALGGNSADYNNIVNNLLVALETIDATISQPIRTEITNTLNHAPTVFGPEYPCDPAFVGTRIRQELQCSQSKFMNTYGYVGLIPRPTCLPRAPEVCAITPSPLNLALNPQSIEIYGYDLDIGITTAVADSNFVETDVSNHLTTLSHFHAALDTSAQGISTLNPSDQLLIYGGEKIVLSSISIELGETCLTIEPGSRTFVQPVAVPLVCNNILTLIYCEADKLIYESQVGVNITSSLAFSKAGTELVATTGLDYFTVLNQVTPRYTDATDTFTLFTAAPGSVLTRISTSYTDAISYVDTTAGINTIAREPGSPVAQYELHLAVVQNEGYVKTTFNSIEVCTAP